MDNKVKKKSLSSQLRQSREKAKSWKDSYDVVSSKYYKLQMRLNSIKKVFPEKYFKIKFKIQSENKNVYEYEEIIQDFTLDLAIIFLKRNKIYPETFELIDVKILN